MHGVDPNAFRLDVDTSEFTLALKHLRRLKVRAELVHLKYESGMLTVSIGKTSQDIPATGTWPQTLSVGWDWVEALAKHPCEAAITTLTLVDGKLFGRDFGVKCSLVNQTAEAETSIKREEDLNHAHQILAGYGITMGELSSLIDEADPSTARLWGPGDGRLVEDVALTWKPLAIYGVEPSDIRRLFDRKSRDLWNSGPKSDADGYSPLQRYHVTKREEEALIKGGDSAKAELWRAKDRNLIEQIALAWQHFATYGVEPSGILRLINRKASSLGQ